ncbi:hypothetical protein WN944_023581 [Citrus x changshan-huyou]|uniref:Retroviral polymerase SH3-like domain-containing protein n=1 Tax=Citrus x changshan-huyou TaxID=2935761 RepID=A0AAP0R1B2_9ROSI
MPLKYWQEAFTYAVFTINRLVSPVVGSKTPFELLYSSKRDYSQIKVFGCECFPYLRPYNKHKFDFHTSKCVLLGVSIAHKGYVRMGQSGRIYISASVRFNENFFPFSNYPNFNKNESMNESDFTTLSEKFQVVSYPVNSLDNFTQLAAAHNHSQDAAGNMELP